MYAGMYRSSNCHWERIEHLASSGLYRFIGYFCLLEKVRISYGLVKNIIGLYLQISDTSNSILFKILASDFFLKYSYNFENFSLDSLIK